MICRRYNSQLFFSRDRFSRCALAPSETHCSLGVLFFSVRIYTFDQRKDATVTSWPNVSSARKAAFFPLKKPQHENRDERRRHEAGNRQRIGWSGTNSTGRFASGSCLLLCLLLATDPKCRHPSFSFGGEGSDDSARVGWLPFPSTTTRRTLADSVSERSWSLWSEVTLRRVVKCYFTPSH